MSAMTDAELEKLAGERAAFILWPHYETNSEAYKNNLADATGGILSALRAVRDASAPPQVDATLEQWALKAAMACNPSYCSESKGHHEELAKLISAHARKANEGVNQRLLNVSKEMRALLNTVPVNYVNPMMCEGDLKRWDDAIRAAESAAPGDSESKAENLVRAFRILVKPLAERWRDTPAWHACNNNGVAFRDGEIHVRTGLLQDFYALTYGEGAGEDLEKELAGAVNALLDGLDSNKDESGGLSAEQWQQRISSARLVLHRFDRSEQHLELEATVAEFERKEGK